MVDKHTYTHAQALEDLYVHYDDTVRNASSGIVQFTYGDDGLDPQLMEGGGAGAPLDFERLLHKVGGGRAGGRWRRVDMGGGW